jgi:hypothetical protein
MITLYESILSSTKSGKDVLITDFLDWFMRNNSVQLYKIKREEVNAIPNHGAWDIKITKENSGRAIWSFTFTDYDLTDSLKLPYKINTIRVNDKLADINYTGLDLTDYKDWATEIYNKINFCNCNIEKITKLPERCRILSFSAFTGKGPTHVEKIEGISVGMIKCFHSIPGNPGLYINLNKIKNCKIDTAMQISEQMLMLRENAFLSGRSKKKEFSPQAQLVLKQFFDDNNVKVENCKFFPKKNNTISLSHVGNIEYNKRKDKYYYIPSKE